MADRLTSSAGGANPDALTSRPCRERGDAKTARLPAHRVIEIKPEATLAKPDWIRVRLSNSPQFRELKRLLRDQRLHTVCEEASCSNIGECFGNGTATIARLSRLPDATSKPRRSDRSAFRLFVALKES